MATTSLLELSGSDSLVTKSFDNIKLIEHSPIRITLFYYDRTYSLNIYDHRLSINIVQQNLLTFLWK